jgi:uncharacterized protein YdeI (YjbR/CyaY-like superfamily)
VVLLPFFVRAVQPRHIALREDAVAFAPAIEAKIAAGCELDARPAARAFFETLDSRHRYAILYRQQDAMWPKTRARRLAKFVAMLEAGEGDLPVAD